MPLFGNAQYGINTLFWFVQPHICHAIGDFMNTHGQKLDTYSRLCRQLLLVITQFTFHQTGPSYVDLIELLLTTCIDLDAPRYSCFSPRETMTVREKFFLAIYFSGLWA